MIMIMMMATTTTIKLRANVNEIFFSVLIRMISVGVALPSRELRTSSTECSSNVLGATGNS